MHIALLSEQAKAVFVNVPLKLTYSVERTARQLALGLVLLYRGIQRPVVTGGFRLGTSIAPSVATCLLALRVGCSGEHSAISMHCRVGPQWDRDGSARKSTVEFAKPQRSRVGRRRH